jgi:hypothetical protein
VAKNGKKRPDIELFYFFFAKSHLLNAIVLKLTVSNMFHDLKNIKIDDFFLIGLFLPILAKN